MLNQHLYSHVSIARDNKKKRICIILSQLCSCLNQSAFMKAYLLKGQYLEHQARRYRQNISESNDIEKSYNQYELLQVQDHEKFQSPVSIYFGALGEKEYDCHTLPENTVKILLTSKRLCCSRICSLEMTRGILQQKVRAVVRCRYRWLSFYFRKMHTRKNVRIWVSQ